MKQRQYHTMGTVKKFNKNHRNRVKINIYLKQTYMTTQFPPLVQAIN